MLPQNWRLPTIWEVRRVVSRMKNLVMNYSELEAKVREATNNEPWGASSELMQELAKATNTIKGLEQVMGMIIKRLAESKTCQWRPIYKSFLLIEHLLKHGSEQVKEYLLFHLTFLKTFSSNSYNIDDENGKSQGVNVRTRATIVLNLLENDQELSKERAIARENLHKYKGHGNQDMNSSSYLNSLGHGNNDYYIDFDEVPRISSNNDMEYVYDNNIVSDEYYVHRSESANSSTGVNIRSDKLKSSIISKDDIKDVSLINFD